MKVLWITNIILPPLCKKLNISIPVTGGWMFSLAESLLSVESDLELSVATVYSGKDIVKEKIDNITYYLLPTKNKNKYNPLLENLWRSVYTEIKPDVVHIHGTEQPHGLAFLKACPDAKTVISIQGMISVYSRYFLAGISLKEIYSNLTLRNIFFHDGMLQMQRLFKKKGEYEREMIRLAKNIIGRTSWDYSHTWAINPTVNYFFCNETLRMPFYHHIWSYENCEPHTIFLSQAGTPIKGLHQVLKALVIVLRQYPDAKVYVARKNIIDTSSIYKKLSFNDYGSCIKRLLKKYNMLDKVVFTGPLDENQMCEQYLKANVFVCPSAIENSPNSLGEAQMLQMPFIASYVGGVPDMMTDFEEWMYRYEEVEMLAEKICKVFSMEDKVSFFNPNAILRHDREKNSQRMIEIYKSIIYLCQYSKTKSC